MTPRFVASKYVAESDRKRATTRALCLLGPTPSARRHCVMGAVTVMVRDGASRSANPVAFCAGFRDADVRVACSRTHLKIAETFAPPRRARLRPRTESPNFLCRRAAALEANGLVTTNDPKGETQ